MKAIQTLPISVNEQYLLHVTAVYKASTFTGFATDAAAKVGCRAGLSAIWSLYAYTVKGKAGTGDRQVILINYIYIILKSSMVTSYREKLLSASRSGL